MSASSLFSSPSLQPKEGPSEASAELKLPGALPDLSQDVKAWKVLQAILLPPAITDEFPEDYCCPITHCLMRDPVSAADGQTYEREAIEAWLMDHDTSPLGGHTPLKNKELTPIVFVRNAVQRYVDKKPALKDSKEWYLPQSWIGELAQACASGDEKAIQALAERDRRLLVHRFSEGRYAGKTALQLAADHPKALEAVIALLEKRQSGLALAGLLQADASGWLPLHHAIHAKQKAEILLKLVAWMGQAMERVPLPKSWPKDLNAEGLQGALRWSITHQEVATLRYCLRLGAHPDTPNRLGQTPVYQAIQQGFQEGLSVLLEARADPNLRDERLDDTPLQCAIRQGLSDTVALLKRYRVDFTQALKDGSTPLHSMAEQSSTTMAEVLDQKSLSSAVLNARDGEGCTPLHRAGAKGSAAMLKWLMDKGANRSLKNHRGQTVLHLAARHNQVEVLGMFIERFEGLDTQDQGGNTALHLAAQSGSREAVVGLLTAGASSQIKNQQNKTARQLAEEGGHRATVESWDKTVASLRFKEEEAMKAQGVLGVLLLKQQRLIEAQQQQLEEQKEAMDRQNQQLAKQSQEIAQLRQALTQKAELRSVEEFKGSQQREVSALKESVRPLVEAERERREAEKQRLEAEALERQRAEAALLEQTRREEEAKRKEVEEACSKWQRRLILAADSPLFAILSLEVEGEEKEIRQLLQHVANGEQKKAEAVIQRKPGLLLCKGTVTDLSKREFKEITAFQYAVWALDWHMWRMLLKYLTKEEAGEQMRVWDAQGSHPHGRHVSWQGLIDAYAAYYPNNYTSEYWIKQVGGAQLLLPAHVANEYCHGSRAFYPLPDFGNGGVELTRSRMSSGVDWYDVRCGKEWGHYRARSGGSFHCPHLGHGRSVGYDRAAVAALWETRHRQRVELVKELAAGLSMSPGELSKS